MYIDFHTHKPLFSENSDVLEVVSMHEEVKYPNCFYSIGHHPWWATKALTAFEIENLEGKIKNPLCLGIGECGLDKIKGPEKNIQEEVFYQQIQLANKLGVPLIVHCVRQYDQILHFKKKYGNTQWVIHGFRRNKQLAKSLIDAGICLSVSPLTQMNVSFVEMLQYLPMDSFFIETDSEYSLTIMQRYEILANLKNVNVEDLQVQMEVNFERLFSWKKEFGLSKKKFYNRE